MDLIFSKDDIRNCTLSLLTWPDEPIYEVSTTKKSLLAETTVIKKFRKDGEPEYMGLIELYARTDVCKVWGKDMPPKSDGFFKKYGDILSQNQ
jgi:hypothetical protein